MYEDALASIGLSPNESKIYECLVERGELSVSSIAIAAKVHRRNAYDAIERLVDKGLCFQIASKGKDIYHAVDPTKIKELVAEKEKRIDEILPALRRKYHHHMSPEASFIYRGYEGQKNIWTEMLKQNQDSYVIGAKAAWFDPRLKKPRLDFFKQANQKGIKFIQLFDYEVKKTAIPKQFGGKLRYKFLPPEYSSESVLQFFGDFVINYTGVSLNTTDENTVFFITKSKRLADTYRKWFWFMWKLGIK